MRGDLSYIPATELVQLVRSREVSPVEIVQASLDRIRTVDDAQLFLSATAGPDNKDVFSVPWKPEEMPDDSIQELRLALDMDLGCYAVAPDVEAAVLDVVGALRTAGAVVEEVDLGWTRELPDAWATHWGVYLAAFFGQALVSHRNRMDTRLVRILDSAYQLDAVSFKRLEIVRTEAWQSLARVLDEYDALLCPTMSQTARPVDEDDSMWATAKEDRLFHGLDMTAQFNFFSPCPALSVPAGWNVAGLPCGIQIVGRRYRDDVVLAVGRAIERLRPWDALRPPLIFGSM